MANTQINLINQTDAAVSIKQLSLPSGRRFLSLNIGDKVSIILPGFDQDAIEFAQELVGVIEGAWTDLEDAIEVERAIEAAELKSEDQN